MRLWLLSSVFLHAIGGALLVVSGHQPARLEIPPWVIVETVGLPKKIATSTGQGVPVPVGVSSPLVGEGNELPHYPEEAIRNSWEGRTELLLTIALDGKVTEVDLLSSSGHESLDDAALERALAWRFANYGGKKIRVPIQFALND